jgi:hypothetical protein
MKEEMRENLIDEGIWMRGVFMVLFLIAYNIVEFLILLVALFQFVAVLFTGRVNETVLRLGNNLSFFALETFQYLTFNSNLRPFPFSPWPDEEPGGDLWRDNETAEPELEDVKSDPDDNVRNVDS